MTIVSRSVKFTGLLAAGLAFSAWATPAASAQVMDQVPSDAPVVLKINHLADTNTKIAALLTTLGVTDVVPQLKDPLQSVEQQLNIGAGLDTKRDAAIVFPSAPMVPGAPPAFVLLLPVADYKAFLGSTTSVRTEGDVTVVHFNNREEDVFIENWGTYAAISTKKEFVTARHEGIKTSGPNLKQLDDKDVCFYVNFPAFKAQLLAKFKEDSDQKMADIAKGTDAAKVKVQQASLTCSVNVITEFLNDAQGSTIGISISDQGISSSTVVELPPDSYLGKATAQSKMTDQPLLTGLPRENYIFFTGMTGDGKQFAQIFGDVLSPLLKELPGAGPDGQKLADAFGTWKTALGSFDSAAYGIVAPTAAYGQGPMFRYLASIKADADDVKAAELKVVDIINSSSKVFDGDSSDLLKPTVTAGYKNINAVKFDRLQVEVNPDDTSQSAMRLSEGLTQFFGPDGPSFLLGEPDPKTLIVATGIDDDLLGQAVDAAKANKDELTEDLSDVDSGLPKKRSIAAYLGLGQIMNTALGYMKANGMNMPVQIPKNLPPIGFTYSSEGPDMKIDSFIPMKLMQTLTQAGLNIYMQMNGRGGAGGGL
jgi:hypothetical protein